MNNKPFHVMPIGDLREHKDSKECWCKPMYDEGVYVHNSMDEREKYEIGERNLT